VEIEPVLSLDTVYPNPVVSSAVFRITSPTVSVVDVVVYDTSGRIVHSFIASDLAAGTGSVIWDVPDEIPAGVYTARISDGAGNCDSRRFTVMK
jgi:hypothetical protein